MSTKVKKEKTIDFYLRNNWLKISRIYNAIAKRKYGVSMSIGFILLSIDKEGTPSTKLGPKMGLENTSLPRSLKFMEENGLIYRTTDKYDKRKVLIHVTEEGLKFRTKARDCVVKINEELMSEFTAGELQALKNGLEKLDGIISEFDVDKMCLDQDGKEC